MSTPFRASQASKHGYGRGALRGRGVRRELRGVYVDAWVETGLSTRIAAARLVLPADAEVDGVTALQLLGIEVGTLGPLRLVTAHPHQVRRAGLRVRRSTPAVVAGAARPVAAFLAAARDLDLVELVAAGDWLVRLQLAAPDELVAAAARFRGRLPVTRAGRQPSSDGVWTPFKRPACGWRSCSPVSLSPRSTRP